MKLKLKVLALLSMLLPAASLHATVAVQTITGGNLLPGDLSTTGWAFHANNSVTVSALGWYAPGLVSDSTTVGLWEDGGALLGSATITHSGLLDNFYYTAVPGGINLTAGQDYVIAGLMFGQDTVLANVSSIGTAGEISFLQDRYIYNGGILTRPDSTADFQEKGYYGPNFQFENSTVPDSLFPLANLALLLPFAFSAVRKPRK